MQSSGILVLMIVPALIALGAAIGAAVLYGQIDRASTTAGKVVLWIGVVVLSLVAFGIGGCYAMMFIA